MSVADIIAKTLAILIHDLVAAFVDGNPAAYQRVRMIVPETFRTEAKLIHEEARLARLEGDE